MDFAYSLTPIGVQDGTVPIFFKTCPSFHTQELRIHQDVQTMRVPPRYVSVASRVILGNWNLELSPSPFPDERTRDAGGNENFHKGVSVLLNPFLWGGIFYS